jgi:GTP:adenosylcobinamide-phosphate guanylyltransferase
MTEQIYPKYPVFVMCGRDAKRRKLLEVLDPEEDYKSKALLPFMGKRLIDWHLEELQKSPYVEDLYLIGLSEQDLGFEYPVHYVPVETTAEFGDKLAVGIDYLAAQGKDPELVVISSSDAPGIRLEDINTFFMQLDQYNTFDFIASLVPEDVVEEVFPNSGRVVARFRDQAVFPGELFALSPRAICKTQTIISDLGQRRRKINRKDKNKISLGPMLSYVARRPKTWGVILKYLYGSATLGEAERALSAAFGLQIKGVIIPDAGFGMDMDLPEDFARLETFVKATKRVGH